MALYKSVYYYYYYYYYIIIKAHLADEICENSADLSLLATAWATSVKRGWLPPYNRHTYIQPCYAHYCVTHTTRPLLQN